MLIVDVGPLYAAADRRDRHHRACLELLVGAAGPLVVPGLVVAQVAALLADRIGPSAEVAFARSIAAGELQVEPVLDSEWKRIVELTELHVELPLGIVNASTVALAERLEATTLVSLDRRRFGAVRPHHVPAFRVLP